MKEGKKRPALARLPEIDEAAFALALGAYRAAVEHRINVAKKWEPRAEEIRKADEFSRVRVSFENETYVAERLVERASHLFRCAACRRRPMQEDRFDAEMFAERVKRGPLRRLVEQVRVAAGWVEKTAQGVF